MSSTVGFVAPNSNVFPKNPWIKPSDDPRDGGISGVKKQDKPNPWVLEERPTVYNPVTGETEYRDVLLGKYNPMVCYLA